MKIISMNQIPKTISHKGRRYELDRLHGEDSAVYTWHGYQILVEFISKRIWRIICDMEEETKIVRREDAIKT